MPRDGARADEGELLGDRVADRRALGRGDGGGALSNGIAEAMPIFASSAVASSTPAASSSAVAHACIDPMDE